MSKFAIVLIVVILLLIVAAIGNPSEARHLAWVEQAQQERIATWLESASLPAPKVLIDQLPLPLVIDATTDYENYVLFSRLVSKDRSWVLSMGAFWAIFRIGTVTVTVD
ncbi:MAG: hypothetical protein HY328_14235 [Chloroflexi bacterium]|nr:hypothetical protein [Chloroflexota bacterium]